jgi:hypothetical protein
MPISVRPYSEVNAPNWDFFSAQADQSTFLHTRRFLDYHGERFVDRSLLIEEDGRLCGLFPAAEDPKRSDYIVSHPGITYGGVLHAGLLRGARMIDAMGAIGRHFRKLNYQHLVYKAVPTFYQRRPAQDDLYALFRLGALRTRCDLSSAIDLCNRGSLSERRRRSLKKAQKAGVTITSGAKSLPALWAVLSENLDRKHGVAPVHNLAEISFLHEQFPENISCYCCVLDGEILAGVIVFSTPMADHAQYIASSEKGYEVSALDAVFEHCIAESNRTGKRWFDFGISTEEGGKQLNEGLYGFKTEFGSGGFVHEFYEIQLESF